MRLSPWICWEETIVFEFWKSQKQIIKNIYVSCFYMLCRCIESKAANATCWPERSFEWNGSVLSSTFPLNDLSYHIIVQNFYHLSICSGTIIFKCGEKWRTKVFVFGFDACTNKVSCLWRTTLGLVWTL